MRTIRWQLNNTPWMFSTCRETLHCQHRELKWFSKRKPPNCYRQGVDISSTSVPPRVNWAAEQNARRKECGVKWKAKGRRIPILLIELTSSSFAMSQTQEHPPTLEKFPSKSVTGKAQTVAELLLTPAGESETWVRTQSRGWAWVI